MLYKNNIFSVSTGEKSVHVKEGINPEKNFLLTKADKLATIQDGVDILSLYKLHNGNFAVLTKSGNPIKSDSLVRVDVTNVAAKFNIKIQIGG